MKHGWIVLVCGLILMAGCSEKTTQGAAKGAVAGAASASLLGAVTDLIVDGRVNTHRLERNLVAGAVAGGVAGGVQGSQQDKQEKAIQDQAQGQKKTQVAQDQEIAALEKEIGSDNVQGLVHLINCDHKNAFSIGLKTEKSTDRNIAEAGVILQILTDEDRGNAEGVTLGIKSFLGKSDQIDSEDIARQELEKLMTALINERKIQGLSLKCSQ